MRIGCELSDYTSTTEIAMAGDLLPSSSSRDSRSAVSNGGADGFGMRFWRVFKCHWVDWAAAVVLWLAVEGATFRTAPFARIAPSNDPSLSFPLVKSSVPNGVLVFISIVLPIALMFFAQLVLKRTWGSSWNTALDVHHFVLSVLEAAALCRAQTSVLKVFNGRLRPNFDALQNSGDVSEQRESRLSYPSGHTSFAFTGMVLVALYFCGKTRIFSAPRERSSSVSFRFAVLCFAGLLPLLSAELVASTRTRDYWHNFSDINAGAMIGAASAAAAYHLNYYAITSTLSHEPKLESLEERSI